MLAIYNIDPSFWMSLILMYIEQRVIPSDPTESTMVERRYNSHTMIKRTWYKRGISTPLLRFMGKEEVVYTLLEVHKGIIGQHLKAMALAKNILREVYYWSSMVQDLKECVKK